MKFKEILNESENVVVTDWLQQVEQTYKKYFPKSSISVGLTQNIGKLISIKPYIAKDRSEVSNGIMGNDILHIMFFIEPVTQENENGEICFVGDQTIEIDQRTFATKPDNPYCAYGSRKVPFRKVKGSPDKILKALDKYFVTLKDALKEELKNDNIDKEHAELLKTKI